MTMNPRTKIIYIITSTGIGGAEKILYQTVTGMDYNKYHVSTCSLKEKGEIARYLEKQGIAIHCLNMANKEGFAGWLSTTVALVRLLFFLKKMKPTIVHSFLFRANILARIAGYLTGVPIIISSIRVMGGEKRYFHFIERITSFMVDHYIAVSESVKCYVMQKSKISDKNISVIYNGIDIKNHNYLSVKNVKMPFAVEEGDDILVTVGRLHKQKGHAYLLHAISKVVKEIPKIKLLIIGKGEEENKLKDLAKSLDLTNEIIFVGLRHDVKKLLSLARLFILPSLWEGMPNVLLEAMAAGKAVIATEVGGIPEVVVHGETGILVPPEDSDALAKSIKYLLQDEIKINKMGETGRVQVEKHFTIAKMLERTEILYQKLLKEKSQL